MEGRGEMPVCEGRMHMCVQGGRYCKEKHGTKLGQKKRNQETKLKQELDKEVTCSFLLLLLFFPINVFGQILNVI